MSRVALALAAWLAAGAAGAQEADTTKPAPPVGPRAALIAAKATQARLLDITIAGSRLVAVGEEGVILRSDDGQHWTQSPSPVNVMMTRVRFTDAQHGWALGYSASILQTSDGGATWQLRHYDPQLHAMYDILFLDAQHGFAVGGFGIVLETRDGGTTWSPAVPALADLRLHLNALLRLGDGSLLVTGEHGLIARSIDAGASWQALRSPYIGSFFGAFAQGDKGALIHGMRGNVFVTDNLAACPVVELSKWDPDAQQSAATPEQLGALGWRRIDNPSHESLFGVLPMSPPSLLLFGINGTVLRLSSPTAALVPVKTAAVETLVHAVNFKGRVIAVGRQGILDLGAMP